MRRRALAALVLVLLLAPLAQATHPLVPKPNSELVQKGSGLTLVLNHTYEVRASHQGREEIDQPKTPSSPYYYRLDENRMDFDGGLASSGAVDFGAFFDGQAFGTGEVLRNGDFSYQMHRKTLEKSEDFDGGGIEVDEDVTSKGECRRKIGGGPGERMGQPMPVSAQARLTDGGKTARVSLTWPTLGPEPWEPCEIRTTGERGGESVDDTLDMNPFMAFFYATSLFNKPPGQWQSAQDMMFTFDVPLDRGSATFTRTLQYPLPETDAPAAGHFCPGPPDNHLGSGECVATATLQVRVFVDRCGLIIDSYKAHLKSVQEIPPPQKGAPEAWVVAWGKEAAKEVESLIADTRQHLLVCGEDVPGEEWGPIIRVYEMYRDALLEIAKTVGLTERGQGELLGIERSLQLLGAGGTDDLLFANTEVRGGRFYVNVHSPVGIHAWTPDGRHVGWNDTKGAPDLEIEGAAYEGAPGGYQRITLPAGFYKVGVDEKAEGSYVLNVSWESDGIAGSEEFLARSTEGRATATHYAFDRVDENGTLRLDKFPVHRAAARQEWRFAEPPAASDAQQPAPATDSDEERAPPAATPPASAPTVPAADAPAALQDVETRKDAPAWTALATLAALGFAMGLRRRPK